MLAEKTDILPFLRRHKQRLEKLLDKLLPLSPQQDRLAAAMRYSVLNKGKRLRPGLVYATGTALGVSLERLDAAALSMELIHCYSLIHDDLPAMDDDDLRRGLPSCHKAYDEATAILAGDALQTLAFQVLSDYELNPVGPYRQVTMITSLAKAAGYKGMVLGQSEDLLAENRLLQLPELMDLHQHKTGALFVAGVELAILASNDGYSNEQISALLNYAKYLGLAFQIQDDILDVISDTTTLGKPAGSDEKLNKSTFVRLLGLDGAKQELADNFAQALRALEPLKIDVQILRDLAEYLILRRY